MCFDMQLFFYDRMLLTTSFSCLVFVLVLVLGKTLQRYFGVTLQVTITVPVRHSYLLGTITFVPFLAPTSKGGRVVFRQA